MKDDLAQDSDFDVALGVRRSGLLVSGIGEAASAAPFHVFQWNERTT
jgi:hypothetical protein